MTPTTGVDTGLRWLGNAGQLLLLWLAIPFGILLVGLPFVLLIRGLVEIGEALFGG